MKILHIYRTYFPDPPGGTQEAIRQICLSTQEYDIESRILTLSPSPTPQSVSRSEGEVFRAKSWAAPASCDLGSFDALRQYRALSEWGDVLHFHYPWPFGDVLRMLGGKEKPTVMTYHSDVVRQTTLKHIYAPLARRMLRSMSAVVATSPHYLNSSPVLKKLVSPERLHVIPLGICDYTKDSTLPPQRAHSPFTASTRADVPYILFLGVLRYYKGLHTLVDAAASIQGNIIIAGDGPKMQCLREQASRIGASNIVFAGQVSEAQKAALLSGCRALVLPSHLRSEAFGMVLAEASMFGKPMVCCEIGSGTSYVNQHGITGFVVPPESPHLLAEAANALLTDEAQALRMGAAARARYEKLFSGPALGSSHRDLYDSVTKACS